MMKKCIFFILLSSFLTSYGQDEYQQIRFGVYGDPKISWFAPVHSDITSEGASAGVRYGFDFEAFFRKNYAFSTGIGIEHLGGKLSLTDSTVLELNDEDVMVPSENIINYRFQYLTVPIGLKFLTNEIGYKKFYANLGITPQIMLKSTANIDKIDIKNADATEETRLFMSSYFIGAGMEYYMGGNTMFNVGIYYYNGFTNITKLDQKVTASNVALRIGIMF